MEEIPKSDISQDTHHSDIGSQRMFRLSQILDNYNIDKKTSSDKKQKYSMNNTGNNRLKKQTSIYKLALKTGILVGLMLGSIFGGIFLIISR